MVSAARKAKFAAQYACDHTMSDGWHVLDPKGLARFEAEPPRPWRLRDQLRVEVTSPGSRRMWTFVGISLVVGVVFQNWFAVGFALFLALMFGRKIAPIIRFVRHGVVRELPCRELRLSHTKHDVSWWKGRVGQEGYSFTVSCDQLKEMLEQQGTVICKVVALDEGAALLAFRAPTEQERSQEKAAELSVALSPPRPWASIVGALSYGLVAAVLVAYASVELHSGARLAPFILALAAGVGALRGGPSRVAQLAAVAALLLAYFVALVLATMEGADVGLPMAVESVMEYASDGLDWVLLLLTVFVAWRLPAPR